MTDLVEVARGVWVRTSRRELTTTTIVESDGTVVLIDPAWDPDELATIADEIAQRSWTIIAGIATHAHHDHVLWHPGFGTAPRFASPETVALVETGRTDLLLELGSDWPDELTDLVARLTPAYGTIANGLELVVHDAHAPGHTAVWLADRQVLVCGDMFSDVELPLPFDPDDLAAYTAGLDILAPYVERARVLIPGHGHPTDDPTARLTADRRYLAAVTSGEVSTDERLRNPGMVEVDRRIRALSPSSSGRRSTPG